MSMQGLTKFAYVGAEAYWLAHCAVVLMWEIGVESNLYCVPITFWHFSTIV